MLIIHTHGLFKILSQIQHYTLCKPYYCLIQSIPVILSVFDPISGCTVNYFDVISQGIQNILGVGLESTISLLCLDSVSTLWLTT